MLKDGERPLVGTDDNMLGVRTAPHDGADIAVDGNGLVYPNTGGMSVSKDWRRLPALLIPGRLRAICPHARGSESYSIFRYGDGLYETGPLANDLSLSWGVKYHGTIEPAKATLLSTYQAALAVTCEQWSIAEAEPIEAS